MGTPSEARTHDTSRQPKRGLANWAGNYAYRARKVHRPSSIDEVQDVVASAPRLRVLGSRHSFTGIGDAAELLTLENVPSEILIDRDALTVSVGARATYGELAAVLDREGLALANLASLPHISVAGAVATASHGSGDRNGNLATAVAAIELVGSDGEVAQIGRETEDFHGYVVSLGALGVVTKVTLEVAEAYDVTQHVFEGLPWEVLFEHFDSITAAGYSVSVFTRWGASTDQVWIKERIETRKGDRSNAPATVHAQTAESFFGAPAATVDRHPILGHDPVNCTPQLGVPGLWSDRLPHFRMGFTPSSGAEIQSEYHLPRASAVDALDALRALSDVLRPLVQVSEIRTIAADELWMSPQYRRDTVAVHFTWVPAQAAVENALQQVEAVLEPFAARPHWGKLFLAGAERIAAVYERHTDFTALIDRVDPRGVFGNEWMERHVLRGR